MLTTPGQVAMKQGAKAADVALTTKLEFREVIGTGLKMPVFEKVSNTKLPEMADNYLLAKQAEKDAFLARGAGEVTDLDTASKFSRLEYLHSKYGKLTSRELHERINTPKLRRMLENNSPSKVAENWQGSYPYIGIDDYMDKVYKKGEILYAGEPFPTGYFSTKEAINATGNDAKVIFEGLQVKAYWNKGMDVAVYRNTMGAYKLNVDIIGANGIAKNNPQFGKGGMEQIFLSDFDELLHNKFITKVKEGNINLNNSNISIEEYSRMMNSIK